MISALTFLDSISKDGTPHGMVCLQQVAKDIAKKLHPDPNEKADKGYTEEEKEIDRRVNQGLREEAERDHARALRKWVADGRITGVSATTGAPTQGGNFIYISVKDRAVYLGAIGLLETKETTQAKAEKKRQEYEAAVKKYGNITNAAEALGISRATLPRSLNRPKNKAKKQSQNKADSTNTAHNPFNT